jgi:hypothetical protein
LGFFLRRSLDDEARRIAANIAKLPEHRETPETTSGLLWPGAGRLERTGDLGDVSSLAMCDCRSGGWPQARPMDQRIESFLADVLALAGEEPDVVRDEVRVALGGKWLELLRKLAPQTTRVAVLRDPTLASNIGQFAAIQSAASFSSGVELSVIDSHDVNEIERGLAVFGHEPNGAIITTASPSTGANRKLVISLLRRYRLPDIYPFRYYPADGGLASYGPNTAEQFKRAAEYVDRILKGAKPSELPVQAPTKYELVLNLKAAKAIGLEIPSSLLTTADEVIE